MSNKPKRGWIWLTAAGLACVAVFVVANLGSLFPAPPSNIRIEFSGTEGVKVSGKYIADGKENEINGTVPFAVTEIARDLKFVVNKLEPGQLTVKIFRDDRESGSVMTGGDVARLEGNLERGAVSMLTTSPGDHPPAK